MESNHCKACGHYLPRTLGGDRTTCDCGRTPPLDNLPTDIYICPTCGGHGGYRWGCWGTKENPHDHNYMISAYELVKGKR